MGYLQITARTGAAFAPWTTKWLDGIHVILPFSLLGGLTVIAAVLLLKMPETAHRATAETFADLSDDENKLRTSEMEEMLVLKDVDSAMVT